MMADPAQALMKAAEDRMFAAVAARRGVHPWLAGHGLLGERFGEADLELVAEGFVALQAGYARVQTSATDPRRFELAPPSDPRAGFPALLLHAQPADGPERDDVIALSLKPASQRFWRLTLGADFLGDIWPDANGTIRLRQDAHDYFRQLLKAAAYARRGVEEGKLLFAQRLAAAKRAAGLADAGEALALPLDDPRRRAIAEVFGARGAIQAEAWDRWRIAARPPTGALVLDPLMIVWTRDVALRGVEWVEIVDAPVDGPLGRALMKLNPRFNKPRGPRLTGVEVAQTKRRAA